MSNLLFLKFKRVSTFFLLSNNKHLFFLSRSNVLAGSFFWWNIFHLWHWGDVLCWQRPRGQDRPDDLCLPQVFKYFHNAGTFIQIIWYTIYCALSVKISYFRMTKCTFHKFGTSGNIEKHDALCILPLNIGDFQYMIINIFNPTFSVNEKIYIFIWFWLLFLGFLSSVVIVYRIVIVFSPYIRAFVLRPRYMSANFSNLASECVYLLISFKWSKSSKKYLQN